MIMKIFYCEQTFEIIDLLIFLPTVINLKWFTVQFVDAELDVPW